MNLLDDYEDKVHFSHTRSGAFTLDFHLHENCELYFLLSRDLNYFVEKNIYRVLAGEVIITNPGELHKLTPATSSDELYERIWIQFNPHYVAQFNTASYDLLHCFFSREKGEKNKIPLSQRESEELRRLFTQYERQISKPSAASTQLKLCGFIDILIFINDRFEQYKDNTPNLQNHNKLSRILDYIDHHLTEDLSLTTLERELYINRYYLSKLFKSHIGSTIHEYVIYKRIALAKRYLSEGDSVNEAWEKAGFTDYTSFLKMFKRTVGVLPKNYGEHIETVRRADGANPIHHGHR